MAWLIVCTDGSEWIFEKKPIRSGGSGWGAWRGDTDEAVLLPKGSIEILIGRTLTWEDEPVEIK